MLKEVMQLSILEEKKKHGELKFDFKKQQLAKEEITPLPDLPPVVAKKDLAPLRVGGGKKSNLVAIGNGIDGQTLSLLDANQNSLVPQRKPPSHKNSVSSKKYKNSFRMSVWKEANVTEIVLIFLNIKTLQFLLLQLVKALSILFAVVEQLKKKSQDLGLLTRTTGRARARSLQEHQKKTRE